jgi:hypothetical protein
LSDWRGIFGGNLLECIHSSKYIQLDYIYRPNWHSTESHRSQLKSLKTTPRHAHNLDQNEGDKNDLRLSQHDKKLNCCLRLITIRAARIRLLRPRNRPRLTKASNQKLNVRRRFINFWITCYRHSQSIVKPRLVRIRRNRNAMYFLTCAYAGVIITSLLIYLSFSNRQLRNYHFSTYTWNI